MSIPNDELEGRCLGDNKHFSLLMPSTSVVVMIWQ